MNRLLIIIDCENTQLINTSMLKTPVYLNKWQLFQWIV